MEPRSPASRLEVASESYALMFVVVMGCRKTRVGAHRAMVKASAYPTAGEKVEAGTISPRRRTPSWR